MNIEAQLSRAIQAHANGDWFLKGSALQAAMLAFEFAFDRLGLMKIYSFIYGDNPYALCNATTFGFRHEGCFVQHLRDAETGRLLDLHQMALFKDDFFASCNRPESFRKRFRYA